MEIRHRVVSSCNIMTISYSCTMCTGTCNLIPTRLSQVARDHIWRGEGQNEVYVANLHCSLSRLVSVLENLVE